MRNYRYYDFIMVAFVTVLICSNFIGAAKQAVIDVPLLVAPAAAALVGSKVDDAALQKLDAAARAACRPIDDKRGTKDYRTKVAGVLARRAAQIALERARKA